jgi:hypothetical protein
MVPVSKRQPRRPLLVVEDNDDDETTRVYEGSLSGVLDAIEERWPDDYADAGPAERADESWNEVRPGMALSRTLRPLADGLRSFPFAYLFSIAALGMSGAAWYLSRSTPAETPRPAVAAQATPPVAAAAPKPPIAVAPAPAQPPAETAPATSVAVSKATQPMATQPVRKSPIDVMSLPVAPPAPNRPQARPAH